MKTLKFLLGLMLAMPLILLFQFSSSFAQEISTHFLNLPGEISETNIVAQRIFEDINHDGRCDLLFLLKNNLFISYQNTNGLFSSFEVILIPLQGAIDFADVFPGGEKEICILHNQGISCIEKQNNSWNLSPYTLVQKQTFYKQKSDLGLVREYFAIDLEDDGIPELILWTVQNVYIYRKEKSGSYRLDHAFYIQTRTYLNPIGMNVYSNPLSWLLKKNRGSFFLKEWPIIVRYVDWAKESILDDFLIRDINHDGRKDFVRIQRKQIPTQHNRTSKVYEYQVYFMGEDKKFSSEPGLVILDPHGAWISPTGCDINGDGEIDILKYQIEPESGPLQRPRVRYSLFLAQKNGEYQDNPSQIWETSDFPLGTDPLVDVNGDGFQDLVLIHPETRGFSLGGVIRKYIGDSITAELRVIPFDPSGNFIRQRLIRKKVNVSYVLGIPISVQGDFDGDNFMDMVLMSADSIKIYTMLKDKKNYAGTPRWKAKIPPHAIYEVKDLDGDAKSEIVLYYPGKIGFIKIGPLQ